jgi:hypothetical protein
MCEDKANAAKTATMKHTTDVADMLDNAVTSAKADVVKHATIDGRITRTQVKTDVLADGKMTRDVIQKSVSSLEKISKEEGTATRCSIRLEQSRIAKGTSNMIE